MTKAMIIRLYLDSDIEIGQILQDGMVPPLVPMTVVKAKDTHSNRRILLTLQTL